MSAVTKNRLEWSVFGISLVIILALVGYLAYDAVTMGNAPPIVDVKLGEPQPRDGSYVMSVTLRNLGDETAENVTVEVTLAEGGQDTESAEITIDFLPRQSTRVGWVTFTTDPSTVDKIQPHVLGYQVP